jgi:protein involved in polysaccharide export with SLBB domain
LVVSRQRQTAQTAASRQPVTGDHLVRPDGSLSLGEYGSLQVTGKYVDEIQRSVKQQLAARLPSAIDLDVDVRITAHNSQS